MIRALGPELAGACGSHRQIDALFSLAGAPGDPPDATRIDKAIQWMERCNDDESVDPLGILGELIEFIMKPQYPEHRSKPLVLKILERGNLRYEDGKVSDVSTPAPSPAPPVEAPRSPAPETWVSDEFDWASFSPGDLDASPAPVPVAASPSSPSDSAREITSPIEIFISHAAADVGFTAAFVDLLMASLVGLSGEVVRCTSVPGYKHAYGTRVPSTIRDELRGCKIVIGLLSAKARERAYVMMELGAGWAFERKVVVLLGPNVPFDATGPLSDVQHFTANSVTLADEIGQLIENIAGHTGYRLQPSRNRRAAEGKFLAAVAAADFLDEAPSVRVQAL